MTATCNLHNTETWNLMTIQKPNFPPLTTLKLLALTLQHLTALHPGLIPCAQFPTMQILPAIDLGKSWKHSHSKLNNSPSLTSHDWILHDLNNFHGNILKQNGLPGCQFPKKQCLPDCHLQPAPQIYNHVTENPPKLPKSQNIWLQNIQRQDFDHFPVPYPLPSQKRISDQMNAKVSAKVSALC